MSESLEIKLRRISRNLAQFTTELRAHGMTRRQTENYIETLSRLDKNDYSTYAAVLDTYPHPTMDEFEIYQTSGDPLNSRVPLFYKCVDFGYVDNNLSDLETKSVVNGVTVTDLQKARRLLQYLYDYEQERELHIHKGAILFNVGNIYQENSYNEIAQLFYNRAFIEDDFKHHGAENFPPGLAYAIITLQYNFGNSMVYQISRFLEREFLIPYGFSYIQFYTAFLNKALILPPTRQPHRWLEHVASFTNLATRMEKFYNIPEDLHSSIIGQLYLASIIADFCLIIESYCKYRLSLTGTRISFGTIYSEFRSPHRYGWSGPGPGMVDFEVAGLENTLIAIFNDTYTTGPIKNSFFLTWGLRNKVHHNVFSTHIIHRYFKQIIKKQMQFFLDFVINEPI